MAIRDKKQKAAYMADYYIRNRDKILQQSATYRRNNKEALAIYHSHPIRVKQRKAWARKQRYNITDKEFLDLMHIQQNRCACCGTTEPGGDRKYFCVDHCHVTKKIRGLLCVTCNSGIGLLGDNTESIRKALTYLENFERKL